MIILVSTEFRCKCGRSFTFIGEDGTTLPCPKCDRVYKATYDKNKHSLVVNQILPLKTRITYFLQDLWISLHLKIFKLQHSFKIK